MSLDFALKDITRKWKQTSSYIKTIAIVVAITVFFIYLFGGLGFLIFSKTSTLYNYSTFDVFSKYFKFIIYSSMVLTVIWILVVNHSMISHKTRDLATMKAVGTMQKKINSFFMTESLVVDLIGLLIGIIVGFVGYLVLFFVYSALGYHITIFLDIELVPILIGATLIFVYIINGYELHKLSEKRYAKISSGDIHGDYIAVGGLKLVPKLISRFGFKSKIAVTNLTRKKKSFYRILIMMAVSITMLVTITIGGILIGTTIKSQISGAQNDGVIVIGNRNVVNEYQQRYEEFSNNSLVFDDSANLTQSDYLFNASFVDQLQNSGNFTGTSYWDKRLFVYEYAHEVQGIIVTNQAQSESGASTYNIVGDHREGYVPVVGMEFENYTNDWKIMGSINKTNNISFAVVGDTLAHDFFQAALYQQISFTGGVGLYNITAIVYDSFCAGNATYVPLNELQTEFNMQGKINIAVVGVPNGADVPKLVAEINTAVQKELGSNFEAISLVKTFDNNINSLNALTDLLILIMIILVGVVIFSLMYYQSANFQERARDYVVIHAIGGSGKLIKNIMFKEDIMILLIADFIALGVSLIFDNLFLLSSVVLPPIWQPILMWLVISVVIIILVRITVPFLYKRLSKNRLTVLRVFEQYK